jgi:hypothetical protein
LSTERPSWGAGLARATWVHALVAFAGMGAWGIFANRGHGFGPAILAGVVQGALSATITVFLKRGLEAMHVRLAGWASVVAPPLVACALVLAVLLTAHRLAGTPEVWATIAVPYAVSTSYGWLYTIGLALAARRKGHAR